MNTVSDFRNQRTVLWEAALLLGIICLGLLLRVLFLDQPLGFDEVCSWAFARRMPFMNMLKAALSDPTPPLFYTLLHCTMRLFGDDPALMRLPSVVSGVLIIPAVYWCMREASFPRRDRLYAAALTAVSSMLIYYSQELRAYSLLAFLGVVSCGLHVRCSKNPSRVNNLVYGAAVVILCLTHRYGFLLVAAQLIALVLYKRWRTALTAMAVSLVMIVLILFQVTTGTLSFPYAHDRIASWGSLLALLNMLNVGTIYLPALTGSQNSPWVAYPGLAPNLIISVCGLVTFGLIFAAGFRARKRCTPLQRQYFFSLLICMALPAALALLAGTSLLPRPQWLLRGLLFIWPLYFMAAVICLSYSRMRPYLIAAVILINGLSLYPYFTDHTRCNEVAALQELNRTAGSNDLIVVNPWYMYEVVNYYYQGSAAKVGYDRKMGWIDLALLRAGDAPFDQRFLPAAPVPAVTGSVYVIWGTGDGACLKPFQQNKIYVYDKKMNTWKKRDSL